MPTIYWRNLVWLGFIFKIKLKKWVAINIGKDDHTWQAQFRNRRQFVAKHYQVANATLTAREEYCEWVSVPRLVFVTNCRLWRFVACYEVSHSTNCRMLRLIAWGLFFCFFNFCLNCLLKCQQTIHSFRK